MNVNNFKYFLMTHFEDDMAVRGSGDFCGTSFLKIKFLKDHGIFENYKYF